MATFRLQVVSMDGLEYDGEVERIKLRTIHGDLAILARHMNYVTAIGMGTATVVFEDGTERKAACIGGMLSMMNNHLYRRNALHDEQSLPRDPHNVGMGRRDRSRESDGRKEKGRGETAGEQSGTCAKSQCRGQALQSTGQDRQRKEITRVYKVSKRPVSNRNRSLLCQIKEQTCGLLFFNAIFSLSGSWSATPAENGYRCRRVS